MIDNPQATDRAYYLDDFADEIMPCDATLEGWAEWLSRPDPDWPHDIPKKGTSFACSVTRWEEDIVATRNGSDWQFSRPIGAPDFLAVRFGPGLGWDPDNIIWGEDMEAALREWLSEHCDDCDDEEHIAVGTEEPKVRVVYAENPPRLLVQGVVQ